VKCKFCFQPIKVLLKQEMQCYECFKKHSLPGLMANKALCVHCTKTYFRSAGCICRRYV